MTEKFASLERGRTWPAPAAATPWQPAALALIWQLAWPAILGNLLQSAVGLVNVTAVASLGTAAVAAAGLGQRLSFTVNAVVLGIAAGTTALVARAWGAADHAEANRVIRTSLVLGGGGALLLGVASFGLAEPIVAAFGLERTPRELAITFVRWQSVFYLAPAVTFLLWAGLRAAGDTRTPFWIGGAANLFNIGALYLLVPRLGISGAPIANGAAFAAASLVTVGLWLGGRLIVPVANTADSGSRARLKQIARIGGPACLEQLVWQGGFIVFIAIIGRYFGAVPLAAYNVGVAILAFSIVVGQGFSIAAATLVGQQLGARNHDAARAQGWRTMALAVVSMSVLGLVASIFARPIASSMLHGAEAIRLTTVFIYILSVAQPLMGIDFALSGALRGAGDTRFPLVATMLGFICTRLALAGVLAGLGAEVEWIYAAVIADYALKALLVIGRFRSRRWEQALQTAGAAS